MTIKKIHYSNTEKTDVDYIEDFNNKRYYVAKFILCAGAIQTPALLQRSGVDCGNKLYDHGGILSVLYGKLEGVTTTTDVGDGYTDSELTALGLNIYNIGEGDYDLTNTTLNSSSTLKAMHAVFRHTILSDSDIEKAKLGNDVTTQPTLSTTKGVRYVYNMGNYWNDGGHPGPSQFSNMINNNYDLTSTLIGQHGGSYNYRLM